MTTRAERLRAFVQEMNAPLVWGETDCCAVPLAWLKRERGISVHVPAYRTKSEAMALVKSRGCLLDLAREKLSMLITAHTPQLGDIGILDLSTGQVGAIFINEQGLALLRSEAGFFYLQPRKQALQVWTV